MLAPADWHITANRRLSATALVVVDKRAGARETIESGEQIVMICARPAVQDDHFGTVATAVLEEVDAAHAANQSNTASASAMLRTACCSSAVNGSATSESTSI